MYFEIIGDIEQIETIAAGSSIDDLARLRRQYGEGRWRKLKGIATVRLQDGRIKTAEVHWYEAHGIGKKKIKINATSNNAHKKTTKRPHSICSLYHRYRTRPGVTEDLSSSAG